MGNIFTIALLMGSYVTKRYHRAVSFIICVSCGQYCAIRCNEPLDGIIDVHCPRVDNRTCSSVDNSRASASLRCWLWRLLVFVFYGVHPLTVSTYIVAKSRIAARYPALFLHALIGHLDTVALLQHGFYLCTASKVLHTG